MIEDVVYVKTQNHKKYTKLVNIKILEMIFFVNIS